LLVAAAVICLTTVLNLVRLVGARAPQNPWDSIEIVEAWRSFRGMPVYELAPDGHAAHFYGAMVPWVQGMIFRLVGPNNVSGRVLTLVSALGVVTLLAVNLRGQYSPWYLLVAWAGLFGLNHRSCQYFAENRPDMTALFFAVLALLSMAIGHERQRGVWVVLGSACLGVGFFFKQTVAVLAAVPAIVLVLRGRWPAARDVFLAMIPLAVMAALVVVLRFASPTVYHYMIGVPGAYKVRWAFAAKRLWELLLESPLFVVLFGEWIAIEGASLRNDRRLLWLMAVLAVAIPFCAVAYGKVGGAPNSLLPALLAMMAFCALRLPRLLARLDDSILPLHARLMFGIVLGSLLLMTVFPHSGIMAYAHPWDGEYRKVVAVAANLPGTVVCPEDPTIPLYAQERAGRNLFAELDAHPENGAWPPTLPESILAEFRAADYVVDIQNYWDDHIDDRLLADLGFVRDLGVPLDPAYYRIWRRGGFGAPASAPRTALNRPERAGRDRFWLR
jgi:hypothetical protein